MKNEKVKELWDKMVQIKLEKVISEQENETEDNVEDTQEENNENVNTVFSNCFEYMKNYKLRRDQNVYNYVLDEGKIT